MWDSIWGLGMVLGRLESAKANASDELTSPVARDDDRCLNEDIQRVRERMVDDHNELETGQQTILSAIRTGFKDLNPKVDRLESDVSTLKSGNTNPKFDFYLRVATILAVGIAAIYAKGGI